MVRSYLQNPMKKGIDPNTPRVCKKCGKILPVSMFAMNGKGYYESTCAACKRDASNEHYKELKGDMLEEYWEKRLVAIKQNAKRRKISCRITVADLMACWSRQEGHCFYTGKPMKIGSVDRIDNERGYSPTNIIMCERYVNIFRGDIPRDDFIELCRTIARNHCACQDAGSVPQ